MWLIVVIALVIWYFTARGRAREKQERLALRRFSYVKQMTDGLRLDWIADFVEMTLMIKGSDSRGAPEGPGLEQTKYYSLRRHEAQWQARLTDTSRREEAERLEREIKKGDGGSVLVASRIQDQKQALADLQEPKWIALDDEIAGPIESQYQRFIVHYRQS
jgi:hypothetical protein